MSRQVSESLTSEESYSLSVNYDSLSKVTQRNLETLQRGDVQAAKNLQGCQSSTDHSLSWISRSLPGSRPMEKINTWAIFSFSALTSALHTHPLPVTVIGVHTHTKPSLISKPHKCCFCCLGIRPCHFFL